MVTTYGGAIQPSCGVNSDEVIEPCTCKQSLKLQIFLQFLHMVSITLPLLLFILVVAKMRGCGQGVCFQFFFIPIFVVIISLILLFLNDWDLSFIYGGN